MFRRCLRRLRLRWLALRQRLRDRHQIRSATWSVTCRELEWQTIKTGHLNVRAFIFLADEFPEVRGRWLLSVDRLLEQARSMYRVMAAAGPENYELPADYIAAQLAHLAECVRCQEKACTAIRFYAAIRNRHAASTVAALRSFIY